MDLLRFGPQLPQYNWPNDRANTATTAVAGSVMGVVAEITREKLQNSDSRNAAAAGFAGGLVGLAAELGLQKRRERRIQQRPDPRVLPSPALPSPALPRKGARTGPVPGRMTLEALLCGLPA